MGKRGRIALAVVFAIVVGVLVWQFRDSSEPAYQGKPLQYYLDQLANNYPPTSADDPNVRAIYAMGPAAIPHLRRAFRRKDSAYVKSVIFLRANLPDGMTRRLPSPKPAYLKDLSKASAHALATFGPTARKALPDLIEGLNDGATANMAIYAIMEIGPQPENLSAFLALMKSTNWQTPIYAGNCLGKLGLATPKVLTALTNAVERGTPFGKATAINALGELGPKAESATAVLARASSDTNARVRISSIAALWKIRGKTNAPVALLANALEEELNHAAGPSRRANAFGEREMNLLLLVNLLNDIGKEAQSTVPLLRRLKQEKDVRLRMNTAHALWKMEGETNGVVPLLLEALAHTDPNIRVLAAKLLSEFCVKEHAVLLDFERMLTSQDRFIRVYAAKARWKLEGDKDKTLPALISGLEDHFTYYRNAEIRQVAAETLGEMEAGAQTAVPALLVALNDGVKEVRMAATNSLKRIAPDAVAKAGMK